MPDSDPEDFVARPTRRACSLLTTVALSSRPAPERHSAGSRRAASSRATLARRNRTRSAAGIFTTHRQRSRKHLRPGVWSPDSLRREAALPQPEPPHQLGLSTASSLISSNSRRPELSGEIRCPPGTATWKSYSAISSQYGLVRRWRTRVVPGAGYVGNETCATRFSQRAGGERTVAASSSMRICMARSQVYVRSQHRKDVCLREITSKNLHLPRSSNRRKMLFRPCTEG